MGKPLMIQEEDDSKIEQLKAQMKAKTKIEVVRTALKLLEENLMKIERIKRWEKAARLTRQSSTEILKDFQKHSSLKRSS